MKVGIYVNKTKNIDISSIQTLKNLLTLNSFENYDVSENKEFDDIDVLLILGGDGTVLHLAPYLIGKDIKIICINYGTVGFLSEFEQNETEPLIELLKDIQDKNYQCINRSILSVVYKDKTYYALNEVSVHKAYDSKDYNQMIETSLYIDGEDGDKFVGDGVLICTPTGSTAYSLSCGGAILSPKTEAFMITPICPFSLNARPIVVSDKSDIFLKTEKTEGYLVVDGKNVTALEKGSTISIKKAPVVLEFPYRKDGKYFKKIWKKLR